MGQSRLPAAAVRELIANGRRQKGKLNPRRTGNCLSGQRGSQSTTAIQPRQAAYSDNQERIMPVRDNRQDFRERPLTSRDGGIRTRGLLLPKQAR